MFAGHTNGHTIEEECSDTQSTEAGGGVVTPRGDGDRVTTPSPQRDIMAPDQDDQARLFNLMNRSRTDSEQTSDRKRVTSRKYDSDSSSDTPPLSPPPEPTTGTGQFSYNDSLRSSIRSVRSSVVSSDGHITMVGITMVFVHSDGCPSQILTHAKSPPTLQ